MVVNPRSEGNDKSPAGTRHRSPMAANIREHQSHLGRAHVDPEASTTFSQVHPAPVFRLWEEIPLSAGGELRRTTMRRVSRCERYIEMTLFILTRGTLGLPILTASTAVTHTEPLPNGLTAIYVNGDKHVVNSWPKDLEKIEDDVNTLDPQVDFALLVLPICKLIPFDTTDEIVEFIGTMAYCLGNNVESKGATCVH